MELIPGVQQGQRLTLDGLDKRLAGVEKSLATLIVDFYGPVGEVVPSTPEQVKKDYQKSLEQENKGLQALVEHLRNAIAELTAENVSYKDSLRLHEDRIANLQLDIDEYVRENDRLAADVGNLMEERDDYYAQLREIRSVLL